MNDNIPSICPDIILHNNLSSSKYKMALQSAESIPFICNACSEILVNIHNTPPLSFKDFQYPFDRQTCAGTIDLPWKNNYTVALTNGKNPIDIRGELFNLEGSSIFDLQDPKFWQHSGIRNKAVTLRDSSLLCYQCGTTESRDKPHHEGEHLSVLH